MESSPLVLPRSLDCSLCGAAESPTELVARGQMQFCRKCARGMAAEGKAGTLRGFGRLLAVTALLGAALAGAGWARAHGLLNLAAFRPAAAPVVEVTVDSNASGATEPTVATVAIATPAPAPAPAASGLPNVFNNQSNRAVSDVGNIHLLFVSAPGTDGCLGMASRLYATREAPGGAAATLATKVGDDMKTSFDEGVRYVRKLPRGWEKDFSIHLSFEDKFTPKDGGSAGTGFTLAMLAAVQNVALDPDIAVTGDLTIDGAVQPVGAVVEKLRGAMADKCKITLIPERNAGDAQDLALLDGTEALWETQIFSIATIDGAFSLARRDRPENVQAAIARFNELRARLPAKVTANYLPSPIVRTELQAVLKLAPNHLSAAILLRAAEGQLPDQLSLERSLDEISHACYLFLQTVLVKEKPKSPAATEHQSGGLTVFPEVEYQKSMARLYRLSPILDPRAVEFKVACISYAGALRAAATYKVPVLAGQRTQQQWADLALRERANQQEYVNNLNDSRSKLLLCVRKFSTDDTLRRDLRK